MKGKILGGKQYKDLIINIKTKAEGRHFLGRTLDDDHLWRKSQEDIATKLQAVTKKKQKE